MRNFTDFDKQIIEAINGLTSYDFSIQNLLISFFQDQYYIKVWEDKEAYKIAEIKQFRLLFSNRQGDNNLKAFLIKLFDFEEILSYLLNEGLIKKVNIADFTEVEAPDYPGRDKVEWVMNDLVRFSLFEKFYYTYRRTNELSVLVANKYISQDQQYAKKSLSVARGSLYVAIIAAIIAAIALKPVIWPSKTDKDASPKMEKPAGIATQPSLQKIKDSAKNSQDTSGKRPPAKKKTSPK